MTKTLTLSPTLSLPVELAARTQCIFAQKGAGKTYAAGVQAEEMLAAGVQLCVLDPTGVWWGLQSSAGGGKSPYEIVVMGGGHGDVPLEPDAGEVVAQFLVETGQSVVLDVSQFESQAAQDRFALALATKLYRLKAHDKANLHVFLDEADQFCPMRPQKGQERLLHAWDLIVRLGRSRGLGLTAISQRPAVVHTNIRNNVDLLTCLRVTGLHDFKAMKEWTSIHATADQAREFLESVPTLADGEAWFWSPSWLKIFQRAKVRKKHTFDSSRTPRPGEQAVEPTARRKPDLTKLTEQIRASVERAKESDPKALRAEVQRLRAEVQRLESRPAPAAPAAKVKRVEVPALKDGQIAALDKVMIKLMAVVTKASEIGAGARGMGDAIAAAVLRAGQSPPATAAGPVVARVAPAAAAPPPQPRAARRAADNEDDGQGGVGHGALRRVLVALAENPAGVDDRKLAILADISKGGSTMRGALARGRSAGWVAGGRERMVITDAGRAALGPYDPLPTGAALRAYWQQRVGTGAARQLFDAILAHYPQEFSGDDLAERAGIQPGGSTFRGGMAKLRGLELVERGSFRASEELFEPHERR